MDSAAPVAGSGLMNQVATWTATTMRIAFEQRKIFIFHVGSKDPIEVDFFNVVDIAKGFRGVPQETHIANFPRGKSATFLATLFIHTKGRKKLPVQIAGGDDFRESVQRLKEILEARTIFEDKYRLHGWLERWFFEADMNHTGTVDFRELLQLLKRLKNPFTLEEVKHIFKVINHSAIADDDLQTLNLEEFTAFFDHLQDRPDLRELHTRYINPRTNQFEAASLLQFLRAEQGERKVTLEQSQAIVNMFEPHVEKPSGVLSTEGFRLLLTSSVFDLLDPRRQKVNQDMTFPLSCYFIASSHNTYLTGDQLFSLSSVDIYSKVLLSGCRCVEIDVWNGPDNTPIVTHGGTLTTKIVFEDVIRDAILPFAFVASPYPVILSLEVHCDDRQQDEMAAILVRHLKGYLHMEQPSVETTALPSPNSLKEKILIKAKRKKDTTAEMEQQAEEDDLDEPSSEDEPLSHSLSDLVTIIRPVHFKSFKESKARGVPFEMSSFSESKAGKLAASQKAEFIEYNFKQLSRIYPAGARTMSSNYDPLPLWMVGCQMVALNYQTPGKPMVLNRSLFQLNGNCGYVLKPYKLLSTEHQRRARTPNPESLTLELRVISAQFIPTAPGVEPVIQQKGGLKPYLKAEVSSGNAKTETRITALGSGNNPMWNESFVFNIPYLDLSFLILRVKHQKMGPGKNPVLAQAAIHLKAVRNGYRHIRLRTVEDKPLDPTSLFLHVNWLNRDSNE